jgi:hypothetical protein
MSTLGGLLDRLKARSDVFALSEEAGDITAIAGINSAAASLV